MAEFDELDGAARLRQWWRANGSALTLGVILAIVVLGGWYGWRWYTNRQADLAANLYSQVARGISEDNVTDGVVNAVDRLEDDYSGTPYGVAAALRLADYYVRQQTYDKAIQQLDWALDNADNDGIRQIARVRKARVVWTQGKPEAALAILDADHPPAFDALYAEVIGDIQAARGNRRAAYQAYQRALAALPANAARQPLENKRSDNAPPDQNRDQAGNSPVSTRTDKKPAAAS